MKHILLVLGLIASTGLTVGQADALMKTASNAVLKSSTQELQISLNYTGTDEDGNEEPIDTTRDTGR